MARHSRSSSRSHHANNLHATRPQIHPLESRLAPGDALLGLLSASFLVGEKLAATRQLESDSLQICFEDFTASALANDQASTRIKFLGPVDPPAKNAERVKDTNDEVELRLQPSATRRILMSAGEPSRNTVAEGLASITARRTEASTIPTLRSVNSRLASVPHAPSSKPTQPPPSSPQTPITFEANVGQSDAQVRYLSRGPGYTMFLTGTEAVMVTSNDNGNSADSGEANVIRMKYVGANEDATVVGRNPMPGKVNYFIGQDQSQWRSDVPTFGQVAYQNLYKGIDLVYYGNAHQQLEFDFVVSPGADPNAIKLELSGADQVRINEAGDLLIRAGNTELRQHKPYVYQEVNGVRQEVAGEFRIQNSEFKTQNSSLITHNSSLVTFDVGAYDLSRPLIVDPVVSYSSFLGGNNTDSAEKVAVDAAGNVYVVGFTNSTNFPSVNGGQKTKAGFIDAFVTKVSAQGTLEWSTYLGGKQSDYARGVGVDAAGTIYVTGNTGSVSDFPLLNPLQNRYGRGKWDAFVAKFNPTGAITYSSYLGGTGDDIARGLALDGTGNMYITGSTGSTNFPKVNATQTANGGLLDAFVTKVKADGSSLLFSTYLGGAQNEFGNDIVVDSVGNYYVVGQTVSPNFPTKNPFQQAYGGSFFDAFATKYNAAGTVAYSSFLGGSDIDRGFGVTVDSAGNAYYSGQTVSANFPTANAFQAIKGGNTDVFLTKVNPSGSALIYSTYLGGAGSDVTWGGLHVSAAGVVTISGGTDSTNFPTVQPIQAVKSGIRDAFVSVFNATGSALSFSTFMGGNALDDSYSLDIDPAGAIYIVGETFSPNFPVVNPWQPNKNTFTDGFVAKII